MSTLNIPPASIGAAAAAGLAGAGGPAIAGAALGASAGQRAMGAAALDRQVMGVSMRTWVALGAAYLGWQWWQASTKESMATSGSSAQEKARPGIRVEPMNESQPPIRRPDQITNPTGALARSSSAAVVGGVKFPVSRHNPPRINTRGEGELF